jgi:hypothetical protein
MANSNIHAHYTRSFVVWPDGALNLDREGHIPAIGTPADGGGQDSSCALLQAASELSGGLMGLDGADTRKLDVVTVAQHFEWTGCEPA